MCKRFVMMGGSDPPLHTPDPGVFNLHTLAAGNLYPVVWFRKHVKRCFVWAPSLLELLELDTMDASLLCGLRYMFVLFCWILCYFCDEDPEPSLEIFINVFLIWFLAIWYFSCFCVVIHLRSCASISAVNLTDGGRNVTLHNKSLSWMETAHYE